MALIKLYFSLFHGTEPTYVSVHRDLNTLHDVWEKADQNHCVGMIHIGFVRPKVSDTTQLMKFRGKVLATASAKWALPKEYQSSGAAIGEVELSGQCLPLYLLLKGFGYDEPEPAESFRDSVVEAAQREREITRNEEEKQSEENKPKINPMLLSSVDILNLSVRSSNCLGAANIRRVGDLIQYTDIKLMNLPNFGRSSLGEVNCALAHYGFSLGTRLDGWAPDSMENEGAVVEGEEQQTGNEGALKRFEDDQIRAVSEIPLKENIENTLSKLKDRDRQVIELRIGWFGSPKTLAEVAAIVGGVTRERIRQIQKKYVNRIIRTEHWDDIILIKIGQLLTDREQPLYLEMLEVEDLWFEGFVGNYVLLAKIIEIFTENELQAIKIQEANVVTRIKQDDWNVAVQHFRRSLKDKADTRGWSRGDIGMLFSAALMDKSSLELMTLMWTEFADILQFDGEKEDSVLVAYGRTAESVVEAILHQAEEPLHYSEVAERASKMLGAPVDVRRAQGALQNQGAKLFGRGIYGLERFNPIGSKMQHNIRLVVVRLMYDGPLMKQWHANEIMGILQSRFTSIPTELDSYILNMILDKSEKLVYLRRMVWARRDSGQTYSDRVDMADAFTRILEENGGPLKGIEIKRRLKAVRGVSENLQLQPTDRMIQLGKDYWGLIDRDIEGTEADNSARLDVLYNYLQEAQKGIHVSEIEGCLASYGIDNDGPSSYVLLNLAQREKRFYLGRAMILGLAEWGEDTRRLNIAQAIREVLGTMTGPMNIEEIRSRVRKLSDMEVDGSIANALRTEGAKYDPVAKTWCT